MWHNYNAYTLISVVNMCFISTYMTVMSSKTDNTVFIYPGQVYNCLYIYICSVYKYTTLIII